MDGRPNRRNKAAISNSSRVVDGNKADQSHHFLYLLISFSDEFDLIAEAFVAAKLVVITKSGFKRDYLFLVTFHRSSPAT